jgi:hypothetical protein
MSASIEQVNALHLQLQTLQAEVTSHGHQLAGGTTPATHKVLKPSKPSVFTGSSRSKPNLWLAELGAYFLAADITGNSRTIFAVAQLREGALLWAQVNFPSPGTVEFDTFCEQFRIRFNPISGGIEARAMLKKLKQYDINQYINDFLDIMTRISDMSVADQQDMFINGLRPYLQIKIAEMRTDSTTLNDMMSFVQRLDTVYRTHRAANNYNRFNRKFYRPGQQQPLTERPGNFIQGTNMELGNITSFESDTDFTDSELNNDDQGGNGSVSSGNNYEYHQIDMNNNRFSSAVQRRVPGLSRNDYDKCVQENKCFKCRLTGHIARNCNKGNNAANKFHSKNGDRQRQV